MKSVRLRFLLAMMGIVGGMLLLIWLLQVVMFDQYFMSMRRSMAHQALTRVAELLNNGDLTTDDLGEVQKIAQENNVCIHIEDAVGNVFFDQNTQGAGSLLHDEHQQPLLAFFRLQTTLKPARAVTLEVPESQDTKASLLVGMWIPMGTSQFARYVVINSILPPASSTSTILMGQILLIVSILLVFATLMAFVFSQSITRPIVALSKAAQRIARGKYDAKVEVTQQDEIGELATRFNDMVEQLSKVDQMRKDLLANVSHELRTPLTMIKGYAETMRDITGDNRDKRTHQLNIIIQESDRLSSMVSDILNLSQLESGEANLTKAKFDVSAMVDRVMARYDLHARDGYKIEKQITPGLMVCADEGKVTQVLCNLVNNALNHTGDDLRITVRVRPSGEYVRISVIDTGEGIPPEKIAQIWDRYSKLSGTRRKMVGTGLGLSIVKAIVLAHNGHYGVHSALGMGSTFWFELLMDAPKAEKAETPLLG